MAEIIGEGRGSHQNFPQFQFLKEKKCYALNDIKCLHIKGHQFVRGASKMFHQFYFSKQLINFIFFKDYVLALRGQFCWEGGTKKSIPFYLF